MIEFAKEELEKKEETDILNNKIFNLRAELKKNRYAEETILKIENNEVIDNQKRISF